MKKQYLIYIVEDSPIVAESIAWQLKKNTNYKVVIFPVGELMLMKLNANPDIVILDYNLNSVYRDAKSGLEILKKMRRTPVIILSGNKDIHTAVRMIHLGACDYISKEENDMYDKVEQSVNNIVANIEEELEIIELDKKTKKDLLRIAVLIAVFAIAVFISYHN